MRPNHAASVFWAVFFEAWRAWKGPVGPGAMVGEAMVMSAIAAAVDYGATPKRFTPGWGTGAVAQGDGGGVCRVGARACGWGAADAARPAIDAEPYIRAVAERGVAAIAAFNRWRRGRGDGAFLVGVHQPMRAELTLEGLAVSGTIPAGLVGRYMKMGANPVRPEKAGHHWFLGDGMVHEIRLGAACSYRNRWIRSHLAAAALGQRAAPGPRHGRNDTVNTNVVAIGGRPFAMVEAGSYPVALAPTIEDQVYDPFGGR